MLFRSRGAALARAERRFGPPLRVEPRRLPIQPFLLVRDICVERGEPLVRVVPVDIAERDDILAGEVDQVGAPLAADADRGDVQEVARRGEAAAEDVARDDRHAGAGDRQVEIGRASCRERVSVVV